MEWMTEIIGVVVGGGAAVAAVSPWLKKVKRYVRAASDLATQLTELYAAAKTLRTYVVKANEGGWTQEEGSHAGMLSVKLVTEIEDVVRAARNIK
jgi:hypothetical protein